MLRKISLPIRIFIRHRIAKVLVEKGAEGNPIPDLEFGLCIGEVVHFLENKDFEHQDDIEGRSSSIGGVFRFADLTQDGAKHFPVDKRVDMPHRKRTVFLSVARCF